MSEEMVACQKAALCLELIAYLGKSHCLLQQSCIIDKYIKMFRGKSYIFFDLQRKT